MIGAHHHNNAGTAKRLCRAVLQRRFRPGLASAALEDCLLPGRSQLIDLQSGDKTHHCFLDGAHNDASLAVMLRAAATAGFADAPILLGLAGDKDADAIAHVLPLHRVQRVGYAGERSRGADDWPAAFADTPWHADLASALAATNSHAIISGSFYLVGEALQLAKG